VKLQRLPDGTVLVTAKDQRERRAERVTLALLILWLGVMLSINEPEGLTPLGFGAILLGSALYRRFRGWRAGIVTWVVGAILVGVGLGELASTSDIPWFGIAVVLVGLWMLARASRRAF
jgi:hypothetical protein